MVHAAKKAFNDDENCVLSQRLYLFNVVKFKTPNLTIKHIINHFDGLPFIGEINYTFLIQGS